MWRRHEGVGHFGVEYILIEKRRYIDVPERECCSLLFATRSVSKYKRARLTMHLFHSF